MHILEVSNLYSGYNGTLILRDVNMNVCKGEFIAIFGANGAGKTTLLKTISGLVTPENGRILFKDLPIEKMWPYKIARLGLMHIPEGRLVVPTLSVEGNLLLGFCPKGIKRKNFIQETLIQMYELFPVLKERRSQKAGTLSGGEQQMLAIARGLVSNPELLMIDEPSLGLAPMIVKNVFETLASLNQNLGLTIILVEQNISLALQYVGRCYVMELGKIVLEGKAENFKSNDQIKRIYLGG